MVGAHALYRQVGKKIVTSGGVFDLAVEQPQLFRKLIKNKNKHNYTLFSYIYLFPIVLQKYNIKQINVISF